MLNALIIGTGFALALGFGGRWLEPLDALSHFRAHFALGLLVISGLAFLSEHWICGMPGMLLAAVSLFTVVPFVLPARHAPAGDRPSYTLLQMNLLWNTADYEAAIRRIAVARPDVVTVQELTKEWREALSILDSIYPYQVICREADGFRGDSAVLSRRPFVNGTEPVCESENSLAAARIDFDGIAVTIASHHQLWPWPRGQWRRLDAVREALSALPAPLLLAGDFNAVGWSAFLQAYARATGTRVVRGVGPTWMLDGLPTEIARTMGVGIDNFLASPAVRILGIERLAATASDHLPVLVRFTVTAPDQAFLQRRKS